MPCYLLLYALLEAVLGYPFLLQRLRQVVGQRKVKIALHPGLRLIARLLALLGLFYLAAHPQQQLFEVLVVLPVLLDNGLEACAVLPSVGTANTSLAMVLSPWRTTPEAR